MPAAVSSRVVESGSGGQDLPVPAWQRLEALPDPRSPQGRMRDHGSSLTGGPRTSPTAAAPTRGL
jgi:hypothetical protein